MDLPDAAKILLCRIRKLEPERTTKIMGYILMQDPGEQELIRLAYAPENLLENLIQSIKLKLGYGSKPLVSPCLSPPSVINPEPVSEASFHHMPFSPSSRVAFRAPQAPHWELQPLAPVQQPVLSSDFLSERDLIAEDYGLQNQARFIGFEDQSGSLGSSQSPSWTDFPVKTCHYFNKGFCKHGSSCRYLHESDNFSPIFNPSEHGAEDHMFFPGSLEKLELEISELLKSRRGNPVSIASLPMLYQEMYGRTLQADGYLTESQRHGRAGYSLTKLLARLKRIRLIDRPHGQHAVILAEDASKYNVENQSERNDPGPIVNGSRQIYLTFPAESSFTEEDVSDYFGTFGAVEDVRIPFQQRRMFGFVTFASADTVEKVLAKGNPHFVRNSRVLVKPYREKPKAVERRYMEKTDQVPRFEAPRILRRQLMEEQELALGMERMRLAESQCGHINFHNRQFIGYGMEELDALEDPWKFATREQYNFLVDVFNNSVIDERANHPGTDYTDQEKYASNI